MPPFNENSSSLRSDLRLLHHHYSAFNEIAVRLTRKIERMLNPDGFQKRPKILLIQEIVCAHYGMPITIMTSRLKPARFIEPRAVAMYISREVTHFTLQDIGDCFGRDHGTVTYAINAVIDRLATEPAFANQVASLLELAKDRIHSIDLPLFSRKQIQSA
jgi:chromosomal replication initiation ATPase DnaA